MKTIRLALLAALAASGIAQAAGPSTPAGRAVLDVLEGRSAVAVIAVPYERALTMALDESVAHGKRFQPRGLHYQPVSRSYGTGETLGVVTMGAPNAEALRVMAALRNGDRMTLAAGR